MEGKILTIWYDWDIWKLVWLDTLGAAILVKLNINDMNEGIEKI